ncbi:DUF2332 family protein [Mesorhizobium microcysteis]|uniref:DUF2332 family protein n=1 Tax=Neoaquamicrobium microcysteis TaxID=2682781 RepID=A0A5D4GVW1_9HYPH|nr:DUF2332 family protein [Mesorhizobium microcysteis]TYR31415.1 DUF2332 family protein [Mesorhizobium microcysteis]
MALGGGIAAHFLAQADSCDRLGSPFTARLCRILVEVLDDTTATGARVANWPGEVRDDAVALRMCGGLHRLVLEGRDPGLAAVYPPHEAGDAALASAVRAAIVAHEDALLANLDSPPQTNEIGRSGMLLPGFLAIARETRLPLALCEIGSSGGLNLLFDRFAYSYGDLNWGDAASPVRLAPDIRGAPPPLDGTLSVASRDGCDIAPVDARSQAGRMRLRSYVWPDQPLRHERLEGAFQLAREHEYSLAEADAASFVAGRLAGRTPGSAFALFHSIMWQYMPHETRAAITRAMAQAGEAATAEAPVAHLRMEPLELSDPHATLSLTLWPGGRTRHLARCDYHGRWIEWTGGHDG